MDGSTIIRNDWTVKKKSKAQKKKKIQTFVKLSLFSPRKYQWNGSFPSSNSSLLSSIWFFSSSSYLLFFPFTFYGPHSSFSHSLNNFLTSTLQPEPYLVNPTHQSDQLSSAQIEEYRSVFSHFDKQNSGSIDIKALKLMMRALGGWVSDPSSPLQERES